jgi:Xaa-Pro aminopeptidase
MMWLSGHWNWHCMVEYVAVPLKGDPLQVYSFGGTHLQATRRLSYVKDVRSSGGGQFIKVISEWLHEQGLEKAKIGIAESDWTFHEYVPINHIEQMEEFCPDATIELLPDFFHELVYLKSTEEQEFVAKAGKLVVDAIYAIRDRARPGVMCDGIPAGSLCGQGSPGWGWHA